MSFEDQFVFPDAEDDDGKISEKQDLIGRCGQKSTVSDNGEKESAPAQDSMQAVEHLVSFLPIIELLPGLTIDNDTYRVHGPLLNNDIAKVLAFTSRVKELLLTDVLPGPGQQPASKVSPDIISRLLIRDASTPLLSSLQRLQIISASSDLSYLWFCLVPSLESLEIEFIEKSDETTITTFLKELTFKVPRLRSVEIGQGDFPTTGLNCILQFQNLRQLKIQRAALTLSYSLLGALSTLPELQLLEIDARFALYNAYDPTEPGPEPTDTKAEPINWNHDTLDSETSTASFPQLRDLSITGPISLVHDVLHYLRPHTVTKISLTLIHEKFVMPQHWTLEEPFRSSGRFESVPTHTFKRRRPEDKKWITVTCLGPVDGSIKRRNICPDCEELKISRQFIAQVDFFSLLMIELIEYAGSLESIRLDSFYLSDLNPAPDSEQESNAPLELSSQAFKILQSNLEKLEVRNWTIPGIDELILSLTPSSAHEPRRMKYLYLPVDAALNTTVGPTMLGVIAQKFPNLIELQCCVSFKSGNLDAEALSIDIAAQAAIIHNLRVLSVGSSDEIEIPIEIKVAIAPYISLLYPHLENIRTHKGKQKTDWDSIHELVKMCKTVRSTVENRLQLLGSANDITK